MMAAVFGTMPLTHIGSCKTLTSCKFSLTDRAYTAAPSTAWLKASV